MTLYLLLWYIALDAIFKCQVKEALNIGGLIVIMNNKKHTLEDLFSDNGAFDEEGVVKAIQPLITIQKATNEIFLKDSSLGADRSILAFGLAKKLLKIRGLINSEIITAAELHKKTGIKKGTIDPAFQRLRKAGYIVGKGEYEIPVFRISDIVGFLTNTKR